MANLLSANDVFFQSFQPKQANRFILQIDGVPSYLIKAATRPTINFNPVVIDHINMKRKVAGKAEWADITLTLYDPVVPSAAQAVMEWVRLCYESVTGRAGYNDFYKKDVIIWVLGPVGDKIEEWKLKGSFITSANFGTLDWATDDLVNIEITLTYDYAILNY